MEDYPRTLMELEGRFATDQGCREYLFALRWPEGFVCPRCGGRQAWAASELLSRRVHVPLQPPDVRVPGQAVLSVDPASRSGRAAPLPDFGPPPGIGGGGVKCIPSFGNAATPSGVSGQFGLLTGLAQACSRASRSTSQVVPPSAAAIGRVPLWLAAARRPGSRRRDRSRKVA